MRIAEDPASCDRDCTDTVPMRCIFNFTIEESQMDIDGHNRSVLAYNKQIPGPPIVMCEGDKLEVNIQNRLEDENTTFHLHGIRHIYEPWSDGVPFTTQYPIAPGGSFTYILNATNFYGADPGSYTMNGTFFYHSHVGSQRTDGAYGALIIRSNNPEKAKLYDADPTEYTIVLQEWYASPDNKTLTSILINGSPNGAVFNIREPGKNFMFRIIGAQSEDVPLRLSIDDHHFTAIAADSQNIKPVENLTALWVASGERFGIVVKTKEKDEYNDKEPYKIRVYGYENPNVKEWKKGPYCATALLKYDGQPSSQNQISSDCSSWENIDSSTHRILNPIPNNYSEWAHKSLSYNDYSEHTHKPGNIFIKDLKAARRKLTDLFGGTKNTALMKTHYIELEDNLLNQKHNTPPDIPLLLQNPEQPELRCGSECKLNINPTIDLEKALSVVYTNCSQKIYNIERCKDKKNCICQHVIKMPYAAQYWTEFVLINNNLENTAAHPMHQHGGWFWVVGMGKYDKNITKKFIMEEDCSDCESLEQRSRGLPRNFDLPPAKDTIQVPPGGYVIFRTPLDNKGVWSFHCHINHHLLHGMSMSLQIGGFGLPKNQNQDWCTGPLKTEPIDGQSEQLMSRCL